MYECRIERDSINSWSNRVTSFVIKYPRRVLAEAVTHRLNFDGFGLAGAAVCERTFGVEVSKNTASSRAIPHDRIAKQIEEDPFTPFWTVSRKGMQGDPPTPDQVKLADEIWRYAREDALKRAGPLNSIGIHKQDSNRLLEPFAWTVQLVTSACWSNFFHQRCDAAADPHLRQIARMMYLQFRKSVPTRLEPAQWHLPFVPIEESVKLRWLPDSEQLWSGDIVGIPDLVKHSIARAAWVSYENHDRDGSPEAMLRTFGTLIGGHIKHFSPMEHQATPLWADALDLHPRLRSNLDGWLQARKLLPNEKVTEYHPSEEEVASWGLE